MKTKFSFLISVSLFIIPSFVFTQGIPARQESNPDFIGITSFNEWHEGTQIEPAVPKSIGTYTYENYGAATDPWFYIRKTRELIKKFEK